MLSLDKCKLAITETSKKPLLKSQCVIGFLWNFKHINNPFTRKMIRTIIEGKGIVCPEICSPEELMGENS